MKKEDLKIGSFVYKPYLKNGKIPSTHKMEVYWIGKKYFKCTLYRDQLISIENLRHEDKSDPRFSFSVYLNEQDALKSIKTTNKNYCYKNYAKNSYLSLLSILP